MEAQASCGGGYRAPSSAEHLYRNNRLPSETSYGVEGTPISIQFQCFFIFIFILFYLNCRRGGRVKMSLHETLYLNLICATVFNKTCLKSRVETRLLGVRVSVSVSVC